MSLPLAFSVPAVIDALVTALEPLKDDGVFVLDGPLPQWPKSDAVVVGVGQNQSITQDMGPSGRMARGFYNETASVICSAYSWSDDSDDMKTRRDRTVELLQAVRDVLSDDSTLGGACEIAELGPNLAWVQTNDGEGASVSVGFAVVARTTI